MNKLSKYLKYLFEAPRVIETGKSGKITWRKWNDGTSECWEPISSGAFSPSAQMADQKWWYRTFTGYSWPPGLFVGEPPVVLVTIDNWGSGLFFGNPRGVTTTQWGYTIFKNSNSSDPMHGGVYAVGRWK